ncbi:MAG: peptide-methionine (S)-S-oxide reductase [Candidatus Woesearchaeota archaeon]|jgi:peptide-methionine (S)-S-oxide reductase
MQKATFAAGCFWSVQAEFDKLPGVEKSTVGYTGGAKNNPTYEQVCSTDTGHYEALLIEFNESELSYETLVETFWKVHDPTQADGQGPDIGSQYKSVIFYHSQEQKELAQKAKDAEQKKRGVTIATQILPSTQFYAAEEYHQKYLTKKKLLSCNFH